VQPLFLGVDIAGSDNTWFSVITPGDDGVDIVARPAKTTLESLVEYCQQNPVLAVAIDAPLTTSLSAETGFRPSDLQLRGLLPSKFRNWVASTNSLMAVPVRGMMLADHLSPLVGTILETHPRASLYFSLEKNTTIQDALRNYKTSANAIELIRTLWQAWAQRFGINSDEILVTDGALDALVCATVAWLYHHSPEKLLHLAQDSSTLRGRGPFYVTR
jgi:predicted nuclease with RNAse H fold